MAKGLKRTERSDALVKQRKVKKQKKYGTDSESGSNSESDDEVQYTGEIKSDSIAGTPRKPLREAAKKAAHEIQKLQDTNDIEEEESEEDKEEEEEEEEIEENLPEGGPPRMMEAADYPLVRSNNMYPVVANYENAHMPKTNTILEALESSAGTVTPKKKETKFVAKGGKVPERVVIPETPVKDTTTTTTSSNRNIPNVVPRPFVMNPAQLPEKVFFLDMQADDFYDAVFEALTGISPQQLATNYVHGVLKMLKTCVTHHSTEEYDDRSAKDIGQLHAVVDAVKDFHKRVRDHLDSDRSGVHMMMNLSVAQFPNIQHLLGDVQRDRFALIGVPSHDLTIVAVYNDGFDITAFLG